MLDAQRKKMVFLIKNWRSVESMNYLFLILLCASIYITPAAVLFFAVYYIRQLNKQDFRNPQGQLTYPYFFLGINALVSSIYSLNLLSIGVTIGVVIPYLIYAVYVENCLTPELSVKMLRLLVYLSFPVGIIAFFQKLFIPLVEGRAYSTFANANLYAFFLMMILLITLGLFLENPSRKEKIVYIVISLTNLGALALTESRTVLVALAISVLFLLLLNKRYQFALALLFVCGVFLYSVTINPHLIPRYTVLDANIAQREKLWNIAWDAIRSSPITGRGILSYKFYALQYQVVKTHAHNMLLNVWVEWGIIGVFLLVWSSYIVFRRGLWGLIHSPYRNYIAVLLSCMVGAFIHGIADNPVFNIQTGVLYLMLTSMVMVFTRDYPEKIETPRSLK